jgi:hypothetical protein
MTPIGTPELVLLLVALAGMTAAAIWGVIELKKNREDECGTTACLASSRRQAESKKCKARSN